MVFIVCVCTYINELRKQLYSMFVFLKPMKTIMRIKTVNEVYEAFFLRNWRYLDVSPYRRNCVY